MNLSLLPLHNQGGGSKPGTKAGIALCKHLMNLTENTKPHTFGDIPLHTAMGQAEMKETLQESSSVEADISAIKEVSV